MQGLGERTVHSLLKRIAWKALSAVDKSSPFFFPADSCFSCSSFALHFGLDGLPVSR